LRLIIRPDAEADIAAAYDWYEEQREGLGKEFLEEISNTIAAFIRSRCASMQHSERSGERSFIAFPTESFSLLVPTQSLSLQRCISLAILDECIGGQNQTSKMFRADACRATRGALFGAQTTTA
jgi:hypothetical protein